MVRFELFKPQVIPPLDLDFRPIVLANRGFTDAAGDSKSVAPLVIGLERGDGSVSVFETITSADLANVVDAARHAELLVKCLLWMRGGRRVYVGGPSSIGQHIKAVYSEHGKRSFDAEFMGNVYDNNFEVVVTDVDSVPKPSEKSMNLGRHFEGCRVGFDLGASDRKVAAVVDGVPVFSEEVEWDPRNQSDPEYHYSEIMSAIKKAASYMPRLDAVGGSAAGIYIGNRVKVASLFRGVSETDFRDRVQNIFLRMKEDLGGIPFEVVNDGEVTALAGSMSLEENSVLGIALGSSEAGGYVTSEGCITGWLNELAFVPIDVNPDAPTDEWSGDIGCGASYLSQQAVFRLAPKAGIVLDENLSPAGRLRVVQDMLEKGSEGARLIFETIGVYLGYAIAHYADFYDIRNVLVLGRVTSGEGGAILVDKAKEVLTAEFPDLSDSVKLHLPDESSRRVGQAVAAASLPALEAS